MCPTLDAQVHAPRHALVSFAWRDGDAYDVEICDYH